jgi:NTP pyrophosphatase (non-canonical NTP hydrolase)
MLWLTENIDVKTLLKAVNTFGDRNQEDVAIEEMSELTKAIIKHRRYNTEETKANIREEIADVFIMLVQLIIIHGFDESIIKQKIDRLKNRLKAGDKK